MEAIFFEQKFTNNLFSIWQRPIDFNIKKIRIPGTGFPDSKIPDPEWQNQITFLISDKEQKL